MRLTLSRSTGPAVGIVGGGLLGMTLAWRLQRAGCRVGLLEAGPAVGGLAGSHQVGGYTWDRFYHVILRSDTNLQELLAELGLGPSLRWRTTRTGFYIGERLRSMSTSLEFLGFSELSLIDKLRLAGTLLYASRLKDWRPLERIPVADWLRRLSGERVCERIWLPLLKSKLGENYRVTSAAFIWATISRMYSARRSGMKREEFGYVDGGYARILDRFVNELDREGVEIRCEARAAGVHDLGDGADVRLASGDVLHFDKVILTVPCGQVQRLCAQLSDAERERLARVVYQGITCASLLLRRPLASYYITNITEPWVPFTAVIEMTALVEASRFGGNALVYLPRYLAQDDPFWSRSDGEVRELFLAALERMYPAFRREDVLAFEVSRVRDMLALSTLDYSAQARPAMRTSLPNVFVANSAQIVNGTLNVNETVGLANAAAAELEPLLTGAHAMPRTAVA